LRWKLGILVTGIVIVVIGLVLVPRSHEDKAPQSSASPRVVRLTTVSGAVSSGIETLAVVIGGAMPHRAVRATVMTDERCAPDARGYSHCLNDVRLVDGSVLHLRHNHQMAAVPCLSPGEQIVLEV
jgi:hypothetical protein